MKTLVLLVYIFKHNFSEVLKYTAKEEEKKKENHSRLMFLLGV